MVMVSAFLVVTAADSVDDDEDVLAVVPLKGVLSGCDTLKIPLCTFIFCSAA